MWTRTFVLASLGLAALTGCADDPVEMLEPRTFFVNEMELGLSVGADGALGLDLDGVVSEGEAPTGGCRHEDLIGVGGVEGVDSQLSRLEGALSLFDFGDLNAIVQSYVNEGGLTLLLTIDELNSLDDDPYVTVRALRGSGPVEIGSDGFAEPGQSFDPDPSIPPLFGEGRIEQGVLTFELEGEIDVPLRFLMTEGTVRMRSVQGRAQLQGNQALRATGMLGGVVPTDDLEALVTQALVDGGGNANLGLVPLLNQTLTGFADIDPDPTTGRCRGLSVGVEVAAVSAFVLGDE